MFLLGDWKHGECRLARRGLGSIRVPRVGRCVLATTNFYGKFATREGFRSRQHPSRARSPAMSGPNEDNWQTFACRRSRARSSRDSFVFEELPSQEVRGIEGRVMIFAVCV